MKRTERTNSICQGIDGGQFVVDYLPEPNVRVLVFCEDFTCLAYLSSSYIWLHAYSNESLPLPVLAWSHV